MSLSGNENILIGKWVYENGSVKKDDISLRIEFLISNYLQKVATDETGWAVLYLDPNDNRFWELTYPQSDAQGGGAPSLISLSEGDAKKKYLM